MSHNKLFFIALIACLFAGFSFGIITKKSDGSIQIYPENPGQSIVISANGHVGIATENPTEQLTVSGFVKATGFIGGTVTANSFVGSGAGLTGLAVYVTTINADARYVSWNGTVGNVSINGTISANTLVAGSGGIFGGSAGSIFVASNGKVGVGTTAPAYPLDINGIARSNTGLYMGGTQGFIKAYNGNATAPEVDFFTDGGTTRKMVFGYDGTPSRGIFYGDFLGGGMYFFDANGIALGNNTTTYASNIVQIPKTWDKFIVNGNVGIGTTAPSTKLDVAGTVSASALVVNGTVTANSFVGGLVNNVVAKTGDYSIVTTDSVILVSTNTTIITVTLPVAANVSGRCYTIKKMDNNDYEVRVGVNGSDTIDGMSLLKLFSQHQYVVLVSDGSSSWLRAGGN